MKNQRPNKRTPQRRTGVKTPVLFIVFNRPDETAAVFDTLRQVRPQRLYLLSDGARTGVGGESQRVQQCRAMLDAIDWPCEVRRNFARHNLGCGIRIASGLHWVFRHEESAIILEDDTLPAPSFFDFCEEMLFRYESRQEIMHVNGRNNLGAWQCPQSYFFSHTVNPWGWATWRRAWKQYDFILRNWSPLRQEHYRSLLNDEDQAGFYSYNEQRFSHKILDTWDIQWTHTVLRHSGLSITPKLNLVQNTGFHQAATHTVNADDMRAGHVSHALPFPLRHPETVSVGPTGKRFDRWNFLFEQLNGFKHPAVLKAVYKMLGNSAASPEVGERYKDILPFLYPLKSMQESRQVLQHLQSHLPGNAFLENLMHRF